MFSVVTSRVASATDPLLKLCMILKPERSPAVAATGRGGEGAQLRSRSPGRKLVALFPLGHTETISALFFSPPLRKARRALDSYTPVPTHRRKLLLELFGSSPGDGEGRSQGSGGYSHCYLSPAFSGVERGAGRAGQGGRPPKAISFPKPEDGSQDLPNGYRVRQRQRPKATVTPPGYI